MFSSCRKINDLYLFKVMFKFKFFVGNWFNKMEYFDK